MSGSNPEFIPKPGCSRMPLSFLLLGNGGTNYAAFFACVAFHFAQRALCAAAILALDAADIRLRDLAPLALRPRLSPFQLCNAATTLWIRLKSFPSRLCSAFSADITWSSLSMYSPSVGDCSKARNKAKRLSVQVLQLRRKPAY
jgi:hypothetical protein